MNHDEMIEMGDTDQAPPVMISHEDHELLVAVKLLLEFPHVKVSNGSNASLYIHHDGYHRIATRSNIIEFSEYRRTELDNYRTELEEQIFQTQSLVKSLLKR